MRRTEISHLFVRKGYHEEKTIIIWVLVVIALIILLVATYLIGTGFMVRTNVGLLDHSISEDGTEITLNTSLFSSMGHTRGFKDKVGGVKPHYLTFYSPFGALNSTLGAKTEHILTLDSDDSERYFNCANGGMNSFYKRIKKQENGIRP